MTGELLPLFPLRAVLFPGSALPLHVFEDRYRVLVAESIRDEREFGIIMTDGGTLRAIGCTARVAEVTRRYDDGRMDIVVTGCRRFQLERIASREAPYIVGLVHFLGQSPDEQVADLRENAAALYNRFIARAYDNTVEPVDLAEAGPELSFRIAQKAGMELAERQRLLELPLESARLRTVIEHLEHVIPLLDKLESIDRVVRNDGYL